MKHMVMFGLAALVGLAGWWMGGSDVEFLSHGAEVRIDDHVELDGLTLIEFTADW